MDLLDQPLPCLYFLLITFLWLRNQFS
jgi:hypothetical protein